MAGDTHGNVVTYNGTGWFGVAVGDPDHLGYAVHDGHRGNERDREGAGQLRLRRQPGLAVGAPSRAAEPWTIYSAPFNATKLTQRVGISVAWF
jgi:hypothetical protein